MGSQLLFFDTFSHEVAEELNLDLVQFPSPVIVDEVRVIPLGARVQANFPGGLRLGATNPTQFELEFFVNDLTKPGSSTFESLGILTYQNNGKINLGTEKKIPTDGLVLRGLYKAITLAVYGTFSKSTPEQLALQGNEQSGNIEQPSQSSEGGGGTVSRPSTEDWNTLEDKRSRRSRDSYNYHESKFPWCSSSSSINGSRDGSNDRRRDRSRSPLPSQLSPLRKRNSRSSSRGLLRSPRLEDSHKISPQLNDDLLDDMSDISEGDIPDMPENEERLSISERRFVKAIEEISDEEAEWTENEDHFLIEDFEYTEDVEDELDVDNEDDDELIKVFDVYSIEIRPLTYFNKEEGKIEMNESATVNVLELLTQFTNWEKCEIGREWVEHIEKVTKHLTLLLTNSSSCPEIFLSWMRLSLDMDKAIAQPMPTFKVRHLKSGLRFVLNALLIDSSHFEGQILTAQFLQSGIQRKLLNLFQEEFMSISLKLLILRILDLSLDSKLGMNLFLGALSPQKDIFSSSKSNEKINKSPYSLVLESCLAQHSTRAKFGLSALATKVHLHELCERLNDFVLQERFLEVHEDVSDVLEEILSIYSLNQLSISQSARFLPVESHYEVSEVVFNDALPGFFRLMTYNNVLECLLVLLTHPSSTLSLLTSVFRLLEEFLKTKRGIIFMVSLHQITTNLIRALLQPSDDEPSSLGLELAHKVYAFSQLDHLYFLVNQKKGKTRKDLETNEILSVLQNLYSLSLIPSLGRTSLVYVLSLGDNLLVFLSLLSHDPNKSMKRSAIRGYAIELLLLTIRMSDNVSYFPFLAEPLLNLVKYDENSKLFEVNHWLSPFLDKALDLTFLVNIINKNNNTENTQRVLEPSPELIMSIRLIENLVVPTSSFTEHKFKYEYILIFSLGVYESYLTILNQIISYYSHSYLHTAVFVTDNGFLLMSIIKSIVSTLKPMLEYIIHCRDVHFKDTRPISTLMKTYALLLSVPHSCSSHYLSSSVSLDVIRILLSFTQPLFNPSKHHLSESLWRQMILEILELTLSSPHLYLAGLSLLSELLPLPLPIENGVDTPLTENDLHQIVNARIHWSGILMSLESLLKDVISCLCLSSVSGLLSLLRRVCVQLADLSAPLASIIVKSLVESPKINVSFLSWLLSDSSVKAAFLTLLSSKSDLRLKFKKLSMKKETEKEGEKDTKTDKDNEEANEEDMSHLMTVFRFLCDSEVSLTSSLSNSLPSKDVLVSLIIPSLAEQLMSPKASFASILPAIRTCVLLCENDVGRYYLVLGILKTFPFLILQCATRINKEFDGERRDLCNVLSTLLDMFRLLVPSQKMSWSQFAVLCQWKNSGTNPIIDSLSSSSSPESTHPFLSLQVKLEALIENEEWKENFEYLSSVNQKLKEIHLTEEDFDKILKQTYILYIDSEPEMPTSDSLVDQFLNRTVVIDEEDPPLPSVYWLTMPPCYESSELMNSVPVDLLEISEKYLPKDFDLMEEVRRLVEDKTPFVAIKKKKINNESLMEVKALHGKILTKSFNTIGTSLRSGGRVTSSGGCVRMTSRGGGGNNSNNSGAGGGATAGFRNQRLDSFRSRPPNTSRPPSLHVDDFLVLQSRGQQPTGPTGYNKQSVKAAKELFAQREAAQNKNSIVGYREATKEPVYNNERANEGNGNNEGRVRGREGGNTSGRSNERIRANERGSRNGLRSGGRERGSLGRGYTPTRDHRDEDRRFGNRHWTSSDRTNKSKERFNRNRNGREDGRPRHLRSTMTR